MSSVFLSYAFAERPRAMAVRAALVEDGWTVWMDNSADDSDTISLIEQLGVPPGQDYDGLINRAIEEAAYFLVVDSDTYRARPHCLEELAHAEASGKPVVVTGGSEPDLVWMRAHRELAEAHAQLFPSFRGDAGAAPGPLGRWLFGDARAKSARLLAVADLASTGLGLPDGGSEVLASIVGEERRRRWSRRASGLALLAVLAVIAGFAIASGLSAADDRRRAADTRAAATSLTLANRALRAETTRVALDLAGDAVRTQRNDVTTSALRRVESAAGRERVLRAPSGHYYRAALSPDASTVGLVRRDAVVVVDVASATTTTIASPVDLRRRIVVTSNAVFVLDIDGALRSVDARANTSDVVAAGPFVDLSVDGDDNVWLLAEDGVLHQIAAGTDDLSDVLGKSVYGDALVVDSELHAVYVLGGSYVSAYAYGDEAGGSPVVYDNLWSYNIDFVTSEPAYLGDGGAGESTAAQLTLCRHNVAVSQGWKWLSFSGQRHLMLAPDGTAARHWSFAALYNGAGCGPDGTAWTQGGLESRASSYDPDGWAPESVGSTDAAAHVWAIASIPDGRTVLMESTGVLHLYFPAQMAWSREQGRAASAQPLDGGVAYVDTSGAVEWDPTGAASSVAVGDLGGVPDPRSAATTDTWFVTVEGRLVRVDPAADEPIHDYPTTEPVHDVSLSPDGSTVCAATRDSAICQSAADDDDPLEIDVPVTSGERVATAEWNDGRLLVTTTTGRILLLDLEGAIVGDASAVPGGTAATFVSGAGEVVAATGDGFLRRYDEDLHEVRAGYIQTGGLVLRRLDDERLLLGTTEYDVQLVDPASLSVVALLQHHSPDLRTTVPDASGGLLVSLVPAQERTDAEGDGNGRNDDDLPARLTVIPMPGYGVVLPD